MAEWERYGEYLGVGPRYLIVQEMEGMVPLAECQVPFDSLFLSPEQVQQIKEWTADLVKAGARGDYGLSTALTANIYTILDADAKEAGE